MQELVVDFITSLDGYASAEGWPGWWGLEAPEYLAWLDERPDRDNTILMGANTYRLMYGFAAESEASESDETTNEDAPWLNSPDRQRWCSPRLWRTQRRGPIPSSSGRIQSRPWER